MTCQLQAMKSAGIKCREFIVGDDEIIFANGIVLPVLGYYDASREKLLDEPVHGGWAEFGNDDVGYGWYPIKLISEEEEERRAE